MLGYRLADRPGALGSGVSLRVMVHRTSHVDLHA